MMVAALTALALWTVPVMAQENGASSAGNGEIVPDYERLAASNQQFDVGPSNALEVASEAAAEREEFLRTGGKPSYSVRSIYPAHGPVSGETRVLVRGENFQKYLTTFLDPKCKFGSNSTIVNADYVSCTEHAPKNGERESNKKERTATCIACDGAPPSIESRPVEFTVSLTGDFSDVTNSATFYYYKASRVVAIKPIHGPKDGGTHVQVWGDNFVDFGEDTRCAFGTKSVKAKVHDAGYITCEAPASDVVSRAMPFGVSLNGQQQSAEKIDYWYYNNPQITVAEPASGPGPGPESGGNEVVLRGSGFRPFRPDLNAGDPEISNSTQCAFTALNVWVPATVLNSTRAICVAPPSYYYRQTPVELTLNAQDWTDDGTLYFYYKPPFLFDAQPRQGPLGGGTVVTVVGSNFNNTGNITCRFGHSVVPGRLRSSSEIVCTAPPAL